MIEIIKEKKNLNLRKKKNNKFLKDKIEIKLKVLIITKKKS